MWSESDPYVLERFLFYIVNNNNIAFNTNKKKKKNNNILCKKFALKVVHGKWLLLPGWLVISDYYFKL